MSSLRLKPPIPLLTALTAWAGLSGLAGCQEPPGGSQPPDPCTDGDPGVICTVAGTGERGTNGDGHPVLETHLNLPTALRFDDEGRMVIVDFNNQVLRRVTHEGTVETLAGSGQHAYAEYGAPVRSSGLENPIDVVIGPQGEFYLMELHGARILEATDTMGVVVGSPDNPGYEGYSGDGGLGTEAFMTQSVGLALAPDGRLYFSDTGNHCIRYVDLATDIVDTVAGTGDPELVDGAADQAAFREAHHLTWHDDQLFVADFGNDAVRRIDLLTGQVSTVAGTGLPGYSGDGGPATQAQLHEPSGVAVADDGTVYIADSANHVVRRVDPDGTISTLAGQGGVEGYEGDGGPAEDAVLQLPNNVLLHEGDLYIADTLNSVIRRISGVQ